MKIISWNCRGLGNDLAVRHLKEINRKYLPDIIYLMETKQQSVYVDKLVAELGFSSSFIVPPYGFSGGLVVMWKSVLAVSVLFSSPNIVDVHIQSNATCFYLSCVYGHPNPSLRHITWSKMEEIAQSRQGAWLVVGDFNELRFNNEKQGGSIRPERSFSAFRNLYANCGFEDISHIGNKFSWYGKRGDHDVFCCLDRALANTEASSLFPVLSAEFLELGVSDHRPVVTTFESELLSTKGFFKFDARILSKAGFKDQFTSFWNGANGLPWSSRLAKCRASISRWKKVNRCNSQEEIIRLGLLNQCILTGGSTQQICALRKELSQAYHNEEIFWKTKSRNNWLKSGDKNTKFFFSAAKTRQVRNRISSIIDHSEILHRRDKDIARVACHFFSDLYKSDNPDPLQQQAVFDGFTSRVTSEMNNDLSQPVTLDEIRQAIFSMAPAKAPGPDGFTGGFYQSLWEEVHPQLFEMVQKIFNTGSMEEGMNHTNICLIPKVETPMRMSEYRPISLCNVSYKIISKILVNRLKPILPHIVSEEQAAFIHNRMITDNVLIAHELMHCLKVRRRCSSAFMAVKTDISKADDSMFFSQANVSSAVAIKQILHEYEIASGQKINLQKSAITFGSKVGARMKTQVRNLLNIHNEGGNGKYLGLPAQFGRKKIDLFQYIVEKIKQRTEGWSNKYLSLAGKEILLKSIGMAMPIYSMTCFQLPKGICAEINRVVSQYWWRNSGNRKSMYWLAWNRVTIPKREGGLGFRDIELFKQALLAKQCWRLVKFPNSLLARILKGRYYSRTNILNASTGCQSSFGWRSILAGRDLLQKGLRVLIGNGQNTHLWEDNWLPLDPPRPPKKNEQVPVHNIRVSQLINGSTGTWDLNSVHEMICEEDIPIVLAMKLTRESYVDAIGWHYTTSGDYTVKSGYWLATHLNTLNTVHNSVDANVLLKQQIWKCNVPPKIKHFLWRMLSNALPLGAELRCRHLIPQGICLRCHHLETLNHLFFLCPETQLVWHDITSPTIDLLDPYISFEDKLSYLLEWIPFESNSSSQFLPLYVLWWLWKDRNNIFFKQKKLPWKSILQYAGHDAEEWLSQNPSSTLPRAQNLLQRRNSGSYSSGWTRPSPPLVKINYDAGYKGPSVPATVGWVIRDAIGTFKGACHSRGNCVTSVLEAELQALSMVMQQAWVQGYKRVYFEGDNHLLYKLVTGQQTSFEMANWMRDVIWWAKKFEEIHFGWVQRSSNRCSDLLARNQYHSSSSSYIFFGIPPISLRHLLVVDDVNYT